MTKIMQEEIQRAIPLYCKVKGVSLTELAIKVGIGYNILHSMQQNDWGNIDAKLWRRVWAEVNPDTLININQTKDCKSVFDMCDTAKKNKICIGLTGDTGMGKTTSLKAYALRANVFYISIEYGVAPHVFLALLLKEMGVKYSGNTNGMLNRVADELLMLNEPLLIVDESAKLKDSMILLLHSLRDMTKRNCGMVLAGMPNFQKNLINRVNKGVVGYSEFFRRINHWHNLEGLTSDEIVYVLEQAGITDKEVQKEFRKLNRYGDLDNAIQLHKIVNN